MDGDTRHVVYALNLEDTFTDGHVPMPECFVSRNSETAESVADEWRHQGFLVTTTTFTNTEVK